MLHPLPRALVVLALAASCASTPPPVEAPPPLPARIVIPDETTIGLPPPKAAEDEAARLERRPPPSRKARDYLIAEKEYEGLMKAHPMGFTPEDCAAICKAPQAKVKSDDGRWLWVS